LSSFKDLGLSAPILSALEELNFTEPTEIQAGAIPVLLQGKKDFIGLAHTGTGKTAAFALPLLDVLNTSDFTIRALILSPTRELCQQIADQIDLFNKHNKKLKTSVVYGGTAMSPQLRNLKRPPHILIATPGRLLDHIQRGSVNLSELEYLVLDEADEMLNMGFKEDIDRILKSAPKSKSTWLFSATMPSGIRRIVEKFMKDEVEEFKVSSAGKTNKNISHQYVIHNRDKQAILCRFLDADEGIRAIVFCRTKAGTQSLADELIAKGYNAAALHGDMSQAQRTKVMDKFKSHKLSVCVATDVAARGIDVNDVTHVFHHQLPDDTAYYTHRSGRTARAGKNKIGAKFMHLDPEEILEKAIALEVNRLTVSTKSTSRSDDRRDKGSKGKSDRRKDSRGKRESDRRDSSSRGERGRKDKEYKSDTSKARFFINVGSRDEISRSELLNFLNEQTGIPRKQFGQIDVEKSHSYFEVDKEVSKNVMGKFKGFSIDGRELRVNPDSESSGAHGGDKKRGKKDSKTGKKKGKRKKRR